MNMMKNGRTYLHKCGSHAGCSCCNSKAVRRKQTHALRQAEARAWRKEQT